MNEISKVDRIVSDVLDYAVAFLGITFMIAFAILSLSALVVFIIKGDFMNLVGAAASGLISWMFWSAKKVM